MKCFLQKSRRQYSKKWVGLRTVFNLPFLLILIFAPFAFVKAQLPPGVTFDNYQLKADLASHRTTWSVPADGWSLEYPGQYVWTDDFTEAANLGITWYMQPRTIFPLGVSRFIFGSTWVGTLTDGTLIARGSAFKHKVSGLIKGTKYTFSFLAAGNVIAKTKFEDPAPGADIRSVFIALYDESNRLTAPVELVVGDGAKTVCFTFTAPDTEFELTIGGYLGPSSGKGTLNPWYQIGAGTGEFKLAVAAPTPNIAVESKPYPAGSSTGTISITGTPAYPANIPVTVNYTSPSGSAMRTTSTDGSGKISITNLPAGTYSNFVVKLNCETSPASGSITLAEQCDAGADQSICVGNGQVVIMGGNPGISPRWVAASSNPTATTIANPSDPLTTITGFSVEGTYKFVWQDDAASCSDTMKVVVNTCNSPMRCVDNYAFLTQQTAGKVNDLFIVNIATGDQTLIYPDYSNNNRVLNAIGFNVTDGHLWGSAVNPSLAGTPRELGVGQIFKVGLNGVAHYYNIPGLYTYGYYCGTVDKNGILYLYAQRDNRIFRVDVNPASATYLSLVYRTATSDMYIADWAINPVDGLLYAVDGGPGFVHNLLRIAPNTGVVTTVGEVTGDAAFAVAGFGAAYFDASGNLYIGDNFGGGIYKINTVQNITGKSTASLRSQGKSSSNNDGALCLYSCIKPDAGPDIGPVCKNTEATMKATQVSGLEWREVAGNPGTVTIVNPFDANTKIKNFSAAGTYQFIWSNGGDCNDTTRVTVKDGTCTLPVTLVSFAADKSDDSSIFIEWTTSFEENSRDFEIQKSADAIHWSILKTVPAANNSKGNIDYKVIDNEPYNGINYYRLNMVDWDDSHAYSRIVSVDVVEAVKTTIYPNPTSNLINIKTGDWKNVGRVEIISTSGITVYTSPATPVAQINVKGIPSGNYIIRISRKDGSFSSHKVTIK